MDLELFNSFLFKKKYDTINLGDIMNIIFLDVDGVLNSIRKCAEVYKLTGKSHSGINYPFDENCMNYLKKLVEQTNSFIVITSTWRKDEESKARLLEELKKYGLSEKVLGFTKILDTRSNEIKEYLNSFDVNVNFVILDDISFLDGLNSNLIVTNAFFGFSEGDYNRALKLLKKNYKPN